MYTDDILACIQTFKRTYINTYTLSCSYICIHVCVHLEINPNVFTNRTCSLITVINAKQVSGTLTVIFITPFLLSICFLLA